MQLIRGFPRLKKIIRLVTLLVPAEYGTDIASGMWLRSYTCKEHIHVDVNMQDTDACTAYSLAVKLLTCSTCELFRIWRNHYENIS